MPTILREGSYRFFFYFCDREEPFHVHVEKKDKIAKVWLNPIRLHNSGGFNRAEISQILTIIKNKREILIEAWNAYFGD